MIHIALVAQSTVRAVMATVVLFVCCGPDAFVKSRSTSRGERGEGVISVAIAVLIIASLGALMWVGFKTLWESAEQTTNTEIAKIGK